MVGNIDLKIESGSKVDSIIKSGGLKVGRGRLPEKVIISCPQSGSTSNRPANCNLSSLTPQSSFLDRKIELIY